MDTITPNNETVIMPAIVDGWLLLSNKGFGANVKKFSGQEWERSYWNKYEAPVGHEYKIAVPIPGMAQGPQPEGTLTLEQEQEISIKILEYTESTISKHIHNKTQKSGAW